MLTAEQAALQLGISKNALYGLAAPRGPIPCYRLSPRSIRFKEEDIQEYEQSCRCTSIKKEIGGYLNSVRLSTASDTGLQIQFAIAHILGKPHQISTNVCPYSCG